MAEDTETEEKVSTEKTIETDSESVSEKSACSEKSLKGKVGKFLTKFQIFCIVLIYVSYVIISIAVGIFLSSSFKCLMFEISLALLAAGISILFWVPICKKHDYAKLLKIKYDSFKDRNCSNNDNDDKKKKQMAFKKHPLFTPSKLFILFFILAVIFALWPPLQCKESPKGVLKILDVLRTVMQIFVVDDGLSEFIGYGNEIYDFYVACLCVAAGVLFAYNIVLLFAKEFSAYMGYWLAHPFSNIYVMSELNQKSMTLAESIFLKWRTDNSKDNDKGGYPRFYFCDVYHPNEEKTAELIFRAWQIGAVIMKRDIAELKVKNFAKNSTFYLIGNDEDENVEQAQNICESCKTKIDKNKLTVYVYANGEVNEKIIDSINKFDAGGEVDSVPVRRIDEHYRLALDFFYENGADFFSALKYGENENAESDLQVIKVGFVGFGEYAYELAKVLCCLGQLPKCRLVIYIFDKMAEEKRAKFQSALLNHKANKTDGREVIGRGNINYHDMPYYEIHFEEIDVEENEFLTVCEKKGFTHFFCILGDDKLNFSMADKLAVSFSRVKKEPRIYAMVKNWDYVAQYNGSNVKKEAYKNILYIGTNIERYSYDTIREDKLETRGEMVHKSYIINKFISRFCEVTAETSIPDKDVTEIYRQAKDNLMKVSVSSTAYYQLYKYCNGGKSIDSFFSEEIKKIQRFSEKRLEEKNNATQQDLEERKKELEEKIAENESMLERLIEEGGDEVMLAALRLKTDLLTILLQIVEIDKNISESKTELKKEGIEEITDKQLGILERKLSRSRFEREFNSREYYRRASKERFLFEYLLKQLGYIGFDGNRLIIKNLVSEYGVDENQWKLNSDEEQNYLPSNIPFYNKRKTREQVKQLYKNLVDRVNKMHINKQEFELYNILQKRWIVTRWAGGYELDTDSDGPILNQKNMTHKYLKPYAELYVDESARIMHTLPVINCENVDRIASSDARKRGKAKKAAEKKGKKQKEKQE